MKVRTTANVTRVDHYKSAVPRAASTVVTLAGKGEEIITVYWQIPGWVGFAKDDKYDIEITRKERA